MMNGFDHYVPPPPPPNRKSLILALRRAVRAKDIEMARDVYDTAFWNNISLPPASWYEILMALHNNDRPMLRLLVLHGAAWSPEEAKALKVLYAEQWPQFEKALRGTGIKISLPEGRADPILVQKMHNDLQQRAPYGPPGLYTPKVGQHADFNLSYAVADKLRKGETAAAVDLLKKHNRPTPFNLSEEARIMARVFDEPDWRILSVFDALPKISGVKLAPVTLDAHMIASRPLLVTGLYMRRILSPQQDMRISVLRGWIEKNQNNEIYPRAAAVLFRQDAPPLTTQEADSFIAIYRRAATNTPEIAEKISTHLENSGFFSYPAWTAQRLEQLSALAPTRSRISSLFNRKQAQERFANMTARQILDHRNLSDFLTAHTNNYYMANLRQSMDIIHALNQRHLDGKVSAATRDILRTLKKSGALLGCSAVIQAHLADYLGKEEPGMAKTLMDMGLIPPSAFDQRILARKAGLEINASALYYSPSSATPYQEFFFQVHLETKAPEHFIAARGTIPSYKQAYRRWHADNPPQKPRGFFW